MALPARHRLTQAERVAESAQRLTEAAIELIAEQGFERTTAGEIAERAGYSRPMIAARYGTKEALLEHIMRTECEARWLPELGELRGIDRLLAWIDLLREEPRVRPALTRAFFTLIFESSGPVPSLKPWTRDWMARTVHEATEALREGQRIGIVRADVAADVEAEQFATSGMGLALRWLLDEDLEAYDRALVNWHRHFVALSSDPD